MATRVFLKRRYVADTVYPGYAVAHLTQITPTTAPPLLSSLSRTINSDLKLLLHASFTTADIQPTFTGWRSLEVSNEVTISGTITFNLSARISVGVAGAARLHVKLYRLSSKGTAETLVVEGSANSDLTNTTTDYNFTLTPPSAITFGQYDRWLLKVYSERRTADYDSATVQFNFDGGATATGGGRSWFETTENFTLEPESTMLFMRRTSVNGIGDFLDLLPTRGSTAATTAVTNTVSGGTEVQMTRTAGGILLAFLSPRFRRPWNLVDDQQIPTFGFAVSAHESATAANCSVRLKFSKRAVNGGETLIRTTSYSTELGTTPAIVVGTLSHTFNNPATFAEDDRVILRGYIVPAGGTMGGSRTVTLTYDHNVANGIGDNQYAVYEMPGFKSESDPSAAIVVPGAQRSTMGLSNGL